MAFQPIAHIRATRWLLRLTKSLLVPLEILHGALVLVNPGRALCRQSSTWCACNADVNPLDAGQNGYHVGVGDWIRSRSLENNMLAHLPIIILTSLHPSPIADTAPKFDIARECQFEGGSKPMQERCAADERQARDQLQNEWTQFSPSAKNQCNQETTTDSTPSYVEFLTCLEMERDVKAAK